jgi:para-aminobenzoate synthetase component 1
MMRPPLIDSLPYRPDSSYWFGRLLDQDWPVFLDSGHPLATDGRYDILSAAPRTKLITRGSVTEIQRGAERATSTADPFSLIQEALGARLPPIAGLPFRGGAIGYFGYDLARRLERLPTLAEDAEALPEMAIGLYDWALVIDHRHRRSRLFAPDRRSLDAWLALLQTPDRQVEAPPPFQVTAPVVSNLSHARYRDALEQIQRYLHAGDCYQVNLAQRFAAPAQGDAWHAYTRLRRANPAPFGAYLSFDDCRILCSSPERFLQVRNDRVETKPIKGTRPRGQDPREDCALAESLRLSAKDRAENLMIVDLLRNDLGKVCAIGSVHVPRLFEIERYAHVHHLVSTVRGRLAVGRSALDLLRACFPGGSITGAPKLRAMQIIEELEPHRRGVYCGSIGYIGVDGAMDTNIVIRSLVHSGGVARLWAGGGIVVDSDPEAEYRETLDKAAPLLTLLEQMRQDGRPS